MAVTGNLDFMYGVLWRHSTVYILYNYATFWFGTVHTLLWYVSVFIQKVWEIFVKDQGQEVKNRDSYSLLSYFLCWIQFCLITLTSK